MDVEKSFIITGSKDATVMLGKVAESEIVNVRTFDKLRFYWQSYS